MNQPIDDFDDDLTIGANTSPPIDDFDDDLTIGANTSPPIDDFDDDLTIGANTTKTTTPPAEASRTPRTPADLRAAAPTNVQEWRPPTRVGGETVASQQPRNRSRLRTLLVALVVVAAAVAGYFVLTSSDSTSSSDSQEGLLHVSTE